MREIFASFNSTQRGWQTQLKQTYCPICQIFVCFCTCCQFFNSIDFQKHLQLYLRMRNCLKGTKNTWRREEYASGRVSKVGLVYIKWKDNKEVLFGSNHHASTSSEVMSRRTKDGSLQETSCWWKTIIRIWALWTTWIC